MAKLTGQTIADSYDQLLIVDAANGISASLQAIEAGDTGGSASSLKISTSKCEVIPASDSTSLFEVSQADGTAVLSVDTTNAKVGIGTAAPAADLEIVGGASVDAHLTLVGTEGQVANLCLWADDGDDATDGWEIQSNTGGNLFIKKSTGNLASSSGLGTYATEVMTLAADGNVGIGTASPSTYLHVDGNSNIVSGEGQHLTSGHIILSNSQVRAAGEGASICWLGASKDDAATTSLYTQAEIVMCAANSTDDKAQGMIKLRVKDHWDHDGGGGGWAMRDALTINYTGHVGIGVNSPASLLTVHESGNATFTLEVLNTNTGTYTGQGLGSLTYEEAAAGFYLFNCKSDMDSSPNSEFYVRGDGQIYADGGTAMNTPADYAEYFETVDGNAIKVGTTVVLIDDKIRASKDGETPFGVIRPADASAIIANAGHSQWVGKFKYDDYGAPLREGENRKKIKSDDFVPKLDENGEQIYVPREDRDEWQIVGLLGQVPIDKGQPVASSWIKMKEVSDTVDMYYVFPCAQVIK